MRDCERDARFLRGPPSSSTTIAAASHQRGPKAKIWTSFAPSWPFGFPIEATVRRKGENAATSAGRPGSRNPKTEKTQAKRC